MSCATSLSTGQVYGVARVAREWELARSSFYHQRGLAGQFFRVLQRRGPKTAWTDAALTEKIRAVLAASPFLWRGPSQGVGPVAARGRADLEGPSPEADARSPTAGALPNRPESRESPHGHDHPRPAQ